MKTPVLIPSKNEEARIVECLSRLDVDKTEPIVIVNDTNDRTAEFAESQGATVIETDIPGKLPALQIGLSFLGDRALDGVLILDADSKPVFPSRWAESMKSYAHPHKPSLIGGPVVWSGRKTRLPVNIAITAKYELNARKLDNPPVPEANLLLTPKTTQVLEEIISLDHYYPGEGRLIAEKIENLEGIYERANSVYSATFTSDRFLRKLFSKRGFWLDKYTIRAPEGSKVPYHLFD